MHASNVALLLLAASTTVPVLGVPLPNFNARSEESGAALNKRDFDDSPKFMRRDDTPEQLATRDTGDDVMAAVANTRNFNPEQTIQARNWLSQLMGTMEKLVLRDVTPDELAARDGLTDLVKKYLNSRESGPDHLHDVSSDKISARDIVDDFMATVANTHNSSPEQTLQARNWLTNLAMTAMEDFVLRDVTPDELAARDDLDDFMNTYFLNTRESVSQPDTQARGTPDGPSKTVARDAVADGFIDALLKSRDSSDITPEDLLALASLASRTLDDLD